MRVPSSYLHDHHMAVECPYISRLFGLLDVRSDFRDDGSAKGHVGDEVAVHDIDVQPVRAFLHDAGAGISKSGEVAAENGRSNDRWR